MKKDAGRQRWSPYLRQMKKNGDPDNSLSADERSDDGLTDYHGITLMIICTYFLFLCYIYQFIRLFIYNNESHNEYRFKTSISRLQHNFIVML